MSIPVLSETLNANFDLRRNQRGKSSCFTYFHAGRKVLHQEGKKQEKNRKEEGTGQEPDRKKTGQEILRDQLIGPQYANGIQNLYF